MTLLDVTMATAARSVASPQRTAAGAEIDLVIARGNVRVALEVKTGRPHGRAVRTLAEAMTNLS